jgi:hypothetical protein
MTGFELWAHRAAAAMVTYDLTSWALWVTLRVYLWPQRQPGRST